MTSLSVAPTKCAPDVGSMATNSPVWVGSKRVFNWYEPSGTQGTLGLSHRRTQACRRRRTASVAVPLERPGARRSGAPRGRTCSSGSERAVVEGWGGPMSCIDGLYHERRMFGGSLSSAYFAAALALQGMHGFADRFAAAMAQADTLFGRLNALDGLHVGRLAHGSNIFPLTLAVDINAERFLMTLRTHTIWVMSSASDARQLRLTVNTTILRQPLETLVTAFAGALQESTPH